MIYSCSHLRQLLDVTQLQKKAEEIKQMLLYNTLPFDSIVFCGMSGALIAPLVATMMGKSPILIRKTSDNTHSWCNIEGETDGKNFIIIDDLIATGNTLRHMLEAMKESSYFSHMECVGIVLYCNEYEDDTFGDGIPVYDEVASY